MSRGGRGGGRGGRGGRNQLPWEDPNLKLDGRPSELFPPYDIPQAAPLSVAEESAVDYLLLVRAQIHDGPLYTHTRSWDADPSNPGRVYGQEQHNQRYGAHGRAHQDPFTAMESWSQQFDKKERQLPHLASRPFCKQFFPAELHATLDGEDPAFVRRKPGAASGGVAKTPGTSLQQQAQQRRDQPRKTLQLSRITHVQTAEEVFNELRQANDDAALAPAADDHEFVADSAKALELMQNLPDDEKDLEGVDIGDDYEDHDDPDEEFDDSDADDYNAEAYFDDGEDDFEDDGGDDGGGEGEF